MVASTHASTGEQEVLYTYIKNHNIIACVFDDPYLMSSLRTEQMSLMLRPEKEN